MNKILCSDVIDGLKTIQDNSVHLIVTSPPFNVGIDYDKHIDTMKHTDYLEWMNKVWIECYRVLTIGGRVCINIDATMNLEDHPDTRQERVRPLHVDFTNQLRKLNYIYRGEIIWTKFNCPGKKTSWGSYCSPSNPHIRRNTEYIILVCKEHLTLAGDKNMVDLTQDEFHEWTLSEWRMQPETRNKNHPAPFPRELAKRCIKLFSYVNNVVLDPFNGSGTTTTTAVELGRQYIGIDHSEIYCHSAKMGILNAKKELYLAGGYQYETYSMDRHKNKNADLYT